MSHVLIAITVFLCVFGSMLLGFGLQFMLPNHHLSEESSSAIKLAIGLVGTLAALVLGLLVSSARSSFDLVSDELTHNAVNIIKLDSVLAQYGPPAKDLRTSLKRDYAEWIGLLGSDDATQALRLKGSEVIRRMDTIQRRIAELPVQGDAQRELQSHALRIADDVFATRSLAVLQRGGQVPMPIIAVLVFWLSIIFGTFGLLAPRNGTVMLVYLLCALSASGAIYLIYDIDTPLSGLIKVSLTPLREALVQLGT